MIPFHSSNPPTIILKFDDPLSLSSISLCYHLLTIVFVDWFWKGWQFTAWQWETNLLLVNSFIEFVNSDDRCHTHTSISKKIFRAIACNIDTWQGQCANTTTSGPPITNIQFFDTQDTFHIIVRCVLAFYASAMLLSYNFVREQQQ